MLMPQGLGSVRKLTFAYSHYAYHFSSTPGVPTVQKGKCW